MKITSDPNKRERTLIERDLDFMDAAKVFVGRALTLEDDRFDYGERCAFRRTAFSRGVW